MRPIVKLRLSRKPRDSAGHQPLATRDLKIAAITMTSNDLLLTANRRDFEKVPGLRSRIGSNSNGAEGQALPHRGGEGEERGHC